MNQDKVKRATIKERYLRDPLPVRLGNLSSNLSRLKSFSNHTNLSAAAVKVLFETQFFIEWTAGDASLPLQVELIELQRLLARWRLQWDEIWNDPEKRNILAAQAGNWSQKMLERSGLLNSSRD